MIISALRGGLGNQMFQYAAGLALAEQHRTVLKLDVSWFGTDPQYEAHNRYALSCLNVTEQFATREEIDRTRGVRLTRTERATVHLARVLRLYGYVNRHTNAGHWHRPSTFAYAPEFHALPNPCYLDGMFQSEKFFETASGVLRRHFSFRYPMSAEATALADRIQSGPSIAVHLRRGDYVRDHRFAREFGLLSSSYYRQGIDLIRARHPNAKVFVFSDDIDAIAAEFVPPGPHELVCGLPFASADEALRLMSLCHHQVIANSSFSWWAAWLNGSADKIVVAPDPWFAASDHDTTDLVPATWSQVRARS